MVSDAEIFPRNILQNLSTFKVILVGEMRICAVANRRTVVQICFLATFRKSEIIKGKDTKKFNSIGSSMGKLPPVIN
jgi:hypothetical protein